MNHKRQSTRRAFNSNQAWKLATAVLNAADLPPDGSPDPDIDELMPPGENDWQAIVQLARELVKPAPATRGERAKQRVFVTVQGGVAEVCEDTVPRDVEVEILDFDNLADDAESEICRWSPDLKDYWLMNHRAWGHLLRRSNSNLSPARALALLSTLQSADIVLPTTDGRELRLRRITEPRPEQKELLRQLRITLPERFNLNLECSADSAIA